MADPTPKRHNFDKHADDIARHVADGDPDELLHPKYVAAKLHVSEQWLAKGRREGFGPPWVDLGPRVPRYPRGKFVSYLRSRSKAARQSPKQAPKQNPKQPASKQTKPALEAAE